MGGKRPGAGRPKGTVNKNKREIVEVINKVIPAKERIGLLAELARGITVSEEQKRGEPKVYTKPPDCFALKILEEYASGKPPQSIDLTSGGEKLSVQVVYSKTP